VYVRAVEGESRRGVVLRTDPVTALESVADAARDLGEAGAERVKLVRNRRRRTCGGLVAVDVFRQHISRIGTH